MKKHFLPIFLILFIPVFSGKTFAARYVRQKSNTDIFLSGMLLYGGNWVSINGQSNLMFGGIENLGAGYSQLGKASLYLKGTLWQREGKEPWTITGNILYDSRDFIYDISTEGQFRQETTYQVRIDHINSHVLFGDFYTTFTELELARPFLTMRGVEAHLEPGQSDFLQFSLFAAQMRTGFPLKQEIRGNGTAGYFYLNSIPVKIGSDVVRVEVRDRDEPTRVLESATKIRGVDYMIDYQTGKFIFLQDVIMPETFEGNPIFIVVTYESDKDINKPYVGGSRGVIKPFDFLSVGASYLLENETMGFSSPTNRMVGTDVKVNMGDKITLVAEYAQSYKEFPTDTPASPDRQAWKADLLVRPFKRVQLQTIYRRIADDFIPIGLLENTALISNKEEVQGVVSYRLTDQNMFSLGQRWFHDNIRNVSDCPTNFGMATFGETSYQFINSLLKAGYEYRIDWNDSEPRTVDSHSHIPYVAFNHTFSPLFGIEARYELRSTSDLTDKKYDATLHLLDCRFRTNLTQNLMAYVWPKYGLERARNMKANSMRRLGAEVGVSGKITEWLRTVSVYNYLKEKDLLDGSSDRNTQSLSLFFDVSLSEKLKTLARLESSSQKSPNANMTFTIRTVDIRTYFHPWEHFTVLAALEQRRNKKQQVELNINSWTRLTTGVKYFLQERLVMNTEFGVKWSFNFNELTTDAENISTQTETKSYFVLGGIDYFWNTWFDTVLQYKRVWMTGALQNKRDSIITELGFEVYQGVRLYVGQEYVIYSEGELEGIQDNDYKANKLYFKIIKKF